MLTNLLMGNSRLMVRLTKGHIALGIEHVPIGTSRLKTDQHTISECIASWLPTPKYIPKMTLRSASVQELGSDHGGKKDGTIFPSQSAHSLNKPLLNWVCA